MGAQCHDCRLRKNIELITEQGLSYRIDAPRRPVIPTERSERRNLQLPFCSIPSKPIASNQRFVTGHDFSRAKEAAKKIEGFSP
jgi:hypothetical protein